MFIVVRVREDVCPKCGQTQEGPRGKVGVDIEFGRRGEAEMAFLCKEHLGGLIDRIRLLSAFNSLRKREKLDPVLEDFCEIFDDFMKAGEGSG
jgi:hypothetical protein